MSNHPIFGKCEVLTDEQLSAIADLTEDGMTAREIAEQLDIARRSVHQGRSVMGVTGYNPTIAPQPVDDAAVLRATWGDPVELNPAERTEAVARLSARGMSTAEIARTLRVTTRTVTRHRAKVAA